MNSKPFKQVLADHFNIKFLWLMLQEALFIFANSLLLIFLPLYLIKELKFPLWLALMPIAIAMLSYGSLGFFGYKIQRKIGTKRFFLLHLIFGLFHGLFLFLIPYDSRAFYVYLTLAPISGLFSIWQPYQTYLAKYTNHRYRGLQFGFEGIVKLLAAALGIAAGGILLQYAGYFWFIVIIYIFNVLRIIPILMLDNFYEPQMKWSFTETFKILFSKRFRRTTTAQIISGTIESIGTWMWPIFIFLSLRTYIGVGSVLSIALFLQVLFVLFVGGLTDKLGRKFVLVWGVVLNSFVWLGRFAIKFLPKKVILFLGLETYAKFVSATIGLPYYSTLYDKIEKNLDYLPLFDIMHHVGSVPAIVLLVLLFYLFPALENFIYILFLICAVLVYFLPLAYNRER